MTALQLFSAFYGQLGHSKQYQNWVKNNPGDAARWKTYASAILDGNHPSVPTMSTPFGLALVDVGKLALAQAAVGAGFGISNFGVGTFGEQP